MSVTPGAKRDMCRFQAETYAKDFDASTEAVFSALVRIKAEATYAQIKKRNPHQAAECDTQAAAGQLLRQWVTEASGDAMDSESANVIPSLPTDHVLGAGKTVISSEAAQDSYRFEVKTYTADFNASTIIALETLVQKEAEAKSKLTGEFDAKAATGQLLYKWVINKADEQLGTKTVNAIIRSVPLPK